MSRIGLKPIAVPAGVTVTLGADNLVTVKGPKGTLEQKMHANMQIAQDGNVITVTRPNEEKQNKSLHGLTRTLINNMIIGVTEGYQKVLEVNGVGYRCQKTGKDVNLNVGFSHPTIVSDTEDCTLEVPQPNQIIVKGIDKQKVGQYAAEIRSIRPPEPYKGKGIKYVDEVIRRKVGKTGGKK